MRSRLIGALGALIALVVLTALGTGSAVGAGGEKVKLSKHDRALLAEQRAEGASHTTLMIATSRGKAGDVAKSVEAIGGEIQYRDDSLGYVRASVPLDRAATAAGLNGIVAVDVDEVHPAAGPAARGRGRPGALGRSAGFGHAGAEPVHADA